MKLTKEKVLQILSRKPDIKRKRENPDAEENCDITVFEFETRLNKHGKNKAWATKEMFDDLR